VTVTVLPASLYVRPCPNRRAVSYLSDGRQVVWEPREPGGALAVDAELLGQSVPPALAARFSPVSNEAFFVAWTRVECAAKLRAIPLLVWLRDRGLHGDPQLRMRTIVSGDLVVTIGQNTAKKNGLKPTAPGSTVRART